MINKSVLTFLLFSCFLLSNLNGCSKDEEKQAASSSETVMSQEKTDSADDSGDSEKPSETTQSTETASESSTAMPDEGSDNQSADNSADMPTKETAESPTQDISGQSASDSGNSEHAEALTLARKSGCLACHAVDKKVVGPAWRDVAKRYKDVTDAKSRLITKVSKGGRGNWTEVVGPAAMPPYSPRVSDENIAKLVDFVLSLEK